VPVVTYIGASRPTYNAWADFSGVQGANQWYYKEYDGTVYTPTTWDAANTRWQGSLQYLQIGPAHQHPETGRDSVRAWVAPRTGTIRIMSGLNGLTTDTNPDADGVQVRIVRNATNVWPSTGYTHIPGRASVPFDAIDLQVAEGDWIYFHERQWGTLSYDTLQWVPQITYR